MEENNKLNEKELVEVTGSEMLSPTIRVPKVENLSESDAIARLTNVGLDFEKIYIYFDSVPKDFVVKTDPSEGTQLTLPSTIRLFISKGQDTK